MRIYPVSTITDEGMALSITQSLVILAECGEIPRLPDYFKAYPEYLGDEWMRQEAEWIYAQECELSDGVSTDDVEQVIAEREVNNSVAYLIALGLTIELGLQMEINI